MSREDPQLKLRLTEDLKAKVADAARTNGRSVNAEIVARLTRTFEDEDAVSDLWIKVEKLESKLEVLWAVHQGRDPYNDDD